MAWRCGSLSRLLFTAARTLPARSPPSSLFRINRPSSPTLRSPLLHSRRPLISVPRTMGQLGCSQSLLPLHSAVAAARLTSHISVEYRACCELSQAPKLRNGNWSFVCCSLTSSGHSGHLYDRYLNRIYNQQQLLKLYAGGKYDR